ncbi:protein tramtrack, beta isoform isoform X2 [Sitodiplosis mosellana]|nr:protein tramtrack, beta isoform isoform X2 [Sitodiplosis mosellana]XP_055301356.1 protein tramtrack, beta isoform isoform X2 [Sitodiplosis mosellana]XP_055301357.1 protein tramtrack, beta isoform isoform X2 [Sitodiplosis mosellana]XP_055301358.1 protein tramtrack, beta isoform isoform X2 [Sitodiplosis mosellana]
MALQQYCLRWKYHHSNLQTMFSQLLDREAFCDVTLACEGQTLRAHRVVLCACSTFFDSILTNRYTDKDPIVIMKDCKFEDIRCLIEFMYKGEINVEHEQLASLLRTAEELRIKGLAEVSWTDENGDSRRSKNKTHNIRNLMHLNETAVTTAKPLQQPKRHSFSNQNSNHQMNSGEMDPLAESSGKGSDEPVQMTKSVANQFLLPVNSPQRSVEETMPTVKKKRGRPPLDDDFDSYSTPKITHVESTANSFDVHADHNAMYDENSHESPSAILEQSMEVSMTCDNDEPTLMPIQPKIERPDTPASVKNDYYDENDYNPSSPMDESSDGHGLSAQVMLTPQEEEEWRDVIKMNDYLAKGRRPQFWEETFTKRVMEAIKSKELEMKKAAQLLGVSYGTLYGRYRETYGCLKHPYRGPFMVSRLREFLMDHGHEDLIGRLQRGEITLPRAAELMNTSLTNLSGLLE